MYNFLSHQSSSLRTTALHDSLSDLMQPFDNLRLNHLCDFHGRGLQKTMCTAMELEIISFLMELPAKSPLPPADGWRTQHSENFARHNIQKDTAFRKLPDRCLPHCWTGAFGDLFFANLWNAAELSLDGLSTGKKLDRSVRFNNVSNLEPSPLCSSIDMQAAQSSFKHVLTSLNRRYIPVTDASYEFLIASYDSEPIMFHEIGL